MPGSGERNAMAFATDDRARARSILGQKSLAGTGRQATGALALGPGTRSRWAFVPRPPGRPGTAG